MSASIAQTWTSLPDACRIGASGIARPANVSPVSSENSRCAAFRRSSSGSTSPLATDQACVVLVRPKRLPDERGRPRTFRRAVGMGAAPRSSLASKTCDLEKEFRASGQDRIADAEPKISQYSRGVDRRGRVDSGVRRVAAATSATVRPASSLATRRWKSIGKRRLSRPAITWIGPQATPRSGRGQQNMVSASGRSFGKVLHIAFE